MVDHVEVARAARASSLRLRMCVLGLLACLCIGLFMLIGVQGDWGFVLPLRARKVLTLLLVGYAIAVSTVLFQTVTENRILTPAVMGFDAFYVLIQSTLIFLLGSHWMSVVDPRLMFAVQVLLMVGFSGMLYWLLFSGSRRSLHLLVLTGVVLGVLFRSLASFIQRLINPSEYAFLQDRFFASFNNPDQSLLALALLIVVAVSLWGVRWLHACDVLTLGRDTAIGLGVEHARTVIRLLVVIAVLTSVATALVGPVTFFGLLVSHLAYRLLPTHRHALLLPSAALIGVICLLGGQMLLEQAFAFDTNLRVIIDFLGGITFILLLMRGGAR
ncbi:iron chelate uptake ABC transporter family permease subunit [Pseudomonas sp. ABC1]|uniref:iron chelate uptake ABC transporter family permease subunit n=1 Tax=Pseudomonas sp. ABC1 TaxID=2748080 RepID=UPI0015C36F6F|nr:iron chelate uptake ABC transporter family permease subunit [Pseudomonas sp. ABC1]QLF93399.1 iron chelate uptake ABC transporter family permease subunit [Pseudomonas sp. ABC1]